MTQPKCKLSYY